MRKTPSDTSDHKDSLGIYRVSRTHMIRMVLQYSLVQKVSSSCLSIDGPSWYFDVFFGRKVARALKYSIDNNIAEAEQFFLTKVGLNGIHLSQRMEKFLLF